MFRYGIIMLSGWCGINGTARGNDRQRSYNKFCCSTINHSKTTVRHNCILYWNFLLL